MIITIDTKEFKKVLDTFSEKDVDRFINKSINDILFDVRDFSLKDKRGIDAEFKIRSRGLIRKHIRVKKAYGLVGYFGSIASPRFSGWTEQQYGTPTKRKIKVHTKHARGPGGRRKLGTRFRRNRKPKSLTKTVSGVTKGYNARITANLAMLRRARERGPVELPVQYGNMKPGIYNLLKSGKMKLMNIFEEKQPERNPWASDIVLRYLATGRYKNIIKKNLGRIILEGK